ncbi:hypothetical protein GCM10020295_79200 [Streptomyces cinereospinus]
MKRSPKAIISCAVTGSAHTPSMSEHLPVTPDEIAEQSVEAVAAGAAIVHLHARDPRTGQPTPDPDVFMRFLPQIKERTNAVVNITTGGAMTMSIEDRLAAARRARPELASMNMGSMNFGVYPAAEVDRVWKHDWEQRYLRASESAVFSNTFAQIATTLRELGDGAGTRFEYECYDVGHLYNLAHMAERGLAKPPFLIQCVFGVLGGIGADSDNLRHMVTIADRLFGDDYHLSAFAAGGTRCRSPRTPRCSAATSGSGSKTACTSAGANWPRPTPNRWRRCPGFSPRSAVTSPPRTRPAPCSASRGRTMSASERHRGAFVVRNVRLFDGENTVEEADVEVVGERIAAVVPRPGDRSYDTDRYGVIDGAGATLMPGLIDSHTHPAGEALALAIRFGVTTELDMFTVPERLGDQRTRAAERDDVADIRSASTGATVLGGHPSMLIGLSFPEQFPVVDGPKDAARFVRDRIAEGADFIKLLIDDGTAMGHPSPTLSEETARNVVAEAHAHGLLAVAHATSVANTLAAVRAGVDGLVHVFMDRPPSEEIVRTIKEAGGLRRSDPGDDGIDGRGAHRPVGRGRRARAAVPPRRVAPEPLYLLAVGQSQLTAERHARHGGAAPGRRHRGGRHRRRRRRRTGHGARRQPASGTRPARGVRAHPGRGAHRGHVGGGGRLPAAGPRARRAGPAGGPGAGER